PIDLFSSAPLGWGASGLAYTVAVAFSLVIAFLVLGRWKNLSVGDRQGAIVVAVSAITTATAYVFVVLVLGPYFADYDTALRYVIPAIVAVVPASIALGGRFFTHGWTEAWRFTVTTAYSAIAVAVLMVFAPSLRQRIVEARDDGHMLAFRFSALTDTYRS